LNIQLSTFGKSGAKKIYSIFYSGDFVPPLRGLRRPLFAQLFLKVEWKRF